MKKVFALLAVVALFGSCKKDWTCECTVLGFTTSGELKDMKKSEAQDSCDAASTAAGILGGSCELK
jgi:hypothetical protein